MRKLICKYYSGSCRHSGLYGYYWQYLCRTMELLFSWNLTTAGQSGLPVSIDVGGGGGTGTQCFNSVLTHQLSTHSNGSHHVMNVRIPTSTISSTTGLQSHPLHPLDQQPGTLLCNAVTKITQSRSENDKEDNVWMFACCYSVSIVCNDCLNQSLIHHPENRKYFSFSQHIVAPSRQSRHGFLPLNIQQWQPGGFKAS